MYSKVLNTCVANLMDFVRHGEIQGRYLFFFKAHGPVFYHVWHSPCRPVVPGCAGCAMAHPDFGGSIDPISTRGDSLCPPNYYWHTQIFRPSDGPGMSRIWIYILVEKIIQFINYNTLQFDEFLNYERTLKEFQKQRSKTEISLGYCHSNQCTIEWQGDSS